MTEPETRARHGWAPLGAPSSKEGAPSRRRRLTPDQLAQLSHGDGRVFLRDCVSWALWVPTATIVRTLLSTEHIIYPRLIAIGTVGVILCQLGAWAATRRYWPWTSPRVLRFAFAAWCAAMLGFWALGTVTGVRPVPVLAIAAGGVLALFSMTVRRVRMQRRATARLASLGAAR